jgi:hypothetical protein
MAVTLKEKIDNLLDTYGISITNGYDISDQILSIVEESWREKIQGIKIKRLDSPRSLGDADVVNVAPGYNQAIQDVLDLLASATATEEEKETCCCIWDGGFRTHDCLTCPVHYPKEENIK